VNHVLLTNNGTTATHLLAKALKSKRKIKNVICPNGVYVAAWNSFLFDNDMTLKLVDLSPDTWNYDEEQLLSAIKNENPEETAILLVHNIGNPFEIKNDKFLIVEDNCEGFLGKYHTGRMTGTEHLASSISFFANKNITCGEGGAFITNDEELYELSRTIHGQGQSSERFIHSHLGYNYRMTNLTSAVLLSQLEVLDTVMEKKNELFSIYRQSFSSYENICVQNVKETCQHSNWMFGVRIRGSEFKTAKQFFEKNGIEIRPMFYSVSQQPYMKDYITTGLVKYENDTNACLLNKETVILPSYPDLSKKEQAHIIETVKRYASLT
jgi:perosamine synthetase